MNGAPHIGLDLVDDMIRESKLSLPLQVLLDVPLVHLPDLLLHLENVGALQLDRLLDDLVQEVLVPYL